jgi:hypothetical protein
MDVNAKLDIPIEMEYVFYQAVRHSRPDLAHLQSNKDNKLLKMESQKLSETWID